MRAVIQRVSQASVSVKNKTIAQINSGLLVFLAVAPQDKEEDAAFLAKKISHLRIMSDSQDKMNLSLKQTGGAMLVVSQFTLYADTKKGHRPSFIKAAPPAQANKLYQTFIRQVRKQGVKVESGQFAAMMQVKLSNDGPVTIIIDSHQS